MLHNRILWLGKMSVRRTECSISKCKCHWKCSHFLGFYSKFMEINWFLCINRPKYCAKLVHWRNDNSNKLHTDFFLCLTKITSHKKLQFIYNLWQMSHLQSFFLAFEWSFSFIKHFGSIRNGRFHSVIPDSLILSTNVELNKWCRLNVAQAATKRPGTMKTYIIPCMKSIII